MPRDNKAEFGYQPNWDRQREKEDEAASNYYQRIHGPIEEPSAEELRDEEDNDE